MSTTQGHDAVEVIIAKRDGGELSDSQIDWVIDAYTAVTRWPTSRWPRWRWRSCSTA